MSRSLGRLTYVDCRTSAQVKHDGRCHHVNDEEVDNSHGAHPQRDVAVVCGS